MDSLLEVSESNGPSWDMEETYNRTLDRPILLGEDEDLLFDDTRRVDDLRTPPTIIPETPSPRLLRTRLQHSNASEPVAIAALVSPPASWGRSPPMGRLSKRRRLCWPGTLGDHATPATSWRTTEFVPASSLLGSWMEPPPPPPSSSSSLSSSLGAPPPSQEIMSGDTQGQEVVTSSTVVPGPLDLGEGRKRVPKRAGSSKPSSKSSASSARPSSRSYARPSTGSSKPSSTSSGGSSKPNSTSSASSARSISTSPGSHGTDVTSLLSSTVGIDLPLPTTVQEIVITDSDDDDFLVQAMVQSVQVMEDEAFARSLQEQIDREEQLQQRRQEAETAHRPSQHHLHNYNPYDPRLGMDWMSLNVPPWFSALGLTGFSPRPQDDDADRPRRRGRSRAPRRRAPRLFVDVPDLDDYEALLDFEERQGTVAKRILTEGQRHSLPTKTYDPAHSAGKTRCQICFSDYEVGEELKILPCLHDYHIQCIDRWLEQSTTCPICRSEVQV